MSNTIGQTAKKLRINVETIRFYERRGLIAQPPKPATGFRHYPQKTIERIGFIRRAQELGFTLNEIAGLLTLNDQPCSQVEELTEQKLREIRRKLNDLRRLEQALTVILTECRSNADKQHCPVISSLQPDNRSSVHRHRGLK